MTRSTQAAQAVLPLPSVHADSLPDPAAPGVRGQRPAPATSATRWRRWTATSASCWTRSSAWGSKRNTIVIWASDGGAEARRPWRGTSGPWRGFYNTAMEGGIRTPVHDPLAGPHPRRPGLQRDRAQHRRLHDARARGRRRGAEGPRHRRRGSARRSSRASRRSRIATASSTSPRAGRCGRSSGATGSCTTSGRTNRASRSSGR